MTLGIIGLGYVGLTLGIVAADKGLTVYGIETNNGIMKCLKSDHAHFYEPGLDDLLKKLNHVRFFSVESFPLDTQFDAFIITVGTPLIEGSKLPNFEYIKSALQSISRVFNGEQLVIVRSTVSVGTTRNIVIPFLSKLCGNPENEILAAMCPERGVEGKALEELTKLPQIISGNNTRSLEIAEKIFSNISKQIVVADSLEEAELAKLYCNVYRDISFSLGNIFCMSAQKFGVNGTNVIKIANEGYPRSNISLPGFVAGPCLEKDAYILTNNMPECPERDFILSARSYNESLENLVVDWVEKAVSPLSDKSNVLIALTGMAFKGTPETNDLRGSSSVYIAKKLFSKGYKLRLHDFVTSLEEIKSLELGEPCSTVENACIDAQLLLVLNNHKNYKTLKPFKDIERDDLQILDIWGVCVELHAKNNINIRTLGDINIIKE